MNTKCCLILTISVLVLTVGFVQAEVLADSGMPMKGANPQRNYNINKKVICPEVAPGRTQVWNIAWETKPSPRWVSFLYEGDVLTQDSEGNIYLQGTEDSNGKIVKIDGASGQIRSAFPISFTSIAAPTHVRGNKMYIASDSYTYIVNTTSMTEIAALSHNPSSATSGSYAPLGTEYMVSTNRADTDIDALRYLRTTTRQFDTSKPTLSAAYAEDVMVHNGNLPIVVHAREEESLTLFSPEYQVDFEGYYYLEQSPYLIDDQVIVHTQFVPASGGNQEMKTLFFNALNGDLTYNLTTKGLNDVAADEFGVFRIFGDKSIGYMGFYQENKKRIVDFLHNKVILEDRDIFGYPQYSVPDNSVLFLSREDTFNSIQELISLDWDTQTINGIGSFPTAGFYSDISLSPPLVGDDCTVYSYYADFTTQNGLFAFKPLPISNIVPILECINEDGVGYFSYNNLEDVLITIPFVSDRNNLSPMSIAPEKTFKASQRNLYFPFSAQVELNNTFNSFTWQLEDYVLSFTNSPQLLCPRNITIVLYFNGTTAPDAEFTEWVRSEVGDFMEISDSRVIVVPPGKRNLQATEFQITLQINYVAELGSAEEKARRFLGQIEDFNSVLSSSIHSSNMLLAVNGVQLSTEIYGTIPPKAAPVAAPIPEQGPSATPSQNAPNSVPKGTTSDGVMHLYMSCIMTALTLAVYLVS